MWVLENGGFSLAGKNLKNVNLELIQAVEAILFASSSPVTALRISKVTGADTTTVKEAISSLQKILEERQSALMIEQVAGGFRLVVKPNFGKVVFEALNKGAAPKLSKAALETLAIVAYKQPISRGEIQKIRGVNPDSSLSTLLEAELIEEIETDSGKSYRTTKKFLEVTGLNSLSELPPLNGT